MVQIIFLNGPSSSGKTSIAKALQESCEEPLMHIGIDKMIGMMPDKLNKWDGGFSEQGFWWKEAKDPEGKTIQEIQAGPYAKKVWETFLETTRLFAELGHFIVVDEVAFGNTDIQRWKEYLKDFTVLWIGVFAPLPILEEREKARGDRMLGSARAQYYKVHEDVKYDVSVNTSKQTLSEVVSSIKKRLRV